MEKGYKKSNITKTSHTNYKLLRRYMIVTTFETCAGIFKILE